VSDVWQPATVLTAHIPEPVPQAGYVYRSLGIWRSMRPSPKGRRPPTWCLTHLGSGHAVCNIKGKVAVAFAIAAEIADLGDWSFDGIDGWKNQFPDARTKMDEIVTKYPCVTMVVGHLQLKES
jgi:hypothetical protein